MYCISCPPALNKAVLGSTLFIFPCICVKVYSETATPHCLQSVEDFYLFILFLFQASHSPCSQPGLQTSASFISTWSRGLFGPPQVQPQRHLEASRPNPSSLDSLSPWPLTVLNKPWLMTPLILIFWIIFLPFLGYRWSECNGDRFCLLYILSETYSWIWMNPSFSLGVFAVLMKPLKQLEVASETSPTQ